MSHSHFPWPIRVLVPIAAVGQLVVVALVAHRQRSARPRLTPTAATRPHPDATHEVRLRDAKEIPVAATRYEHARMMKLLKAGDDTGLTEMHDRRRTFLVPAGTGLLVIDRTPELCEVRVLEGEHRGKAGWLNSACVVERNLTSPAR
jgi:hypothetical protein